MREIPPRIFVDGDRERGFEVLLPFAKKQMEVLDQEMGLSGLFQGQRNIRLSDGSTVRCGIRGTLSDIKIYAVPAGEAPGEEAQEEIELGTWCWCQCCFSSGEVTRLWSDYGQEGNYPIIEGEELYPDLVVDSDLAIWVYNGIRYEVKICNQEFDPILLDFIAVERTFICVASDWSEYAVGDKVIVMLRGAWNGSIMSESICRQGRCEDCGQNACAGTYPANRGSIEDWDKVDGTYIILPLRIEGVNL